MSKKFAIIFIFLSFITQTPSAGGLLARITICDVAGFFGILIHLTEKKVFFTSDIFLKGIFLCTLLLIGGILGDNVIKSVNEIIILVFLIFLFQLIVNSFSTPEEWKTLINIVVYTLLACVIIGFLDLYGEKLGIPKVFPSRTKGEMKSGFKNAGQAGAYVLMILTILLPVRFSNAKTLFSRKELSRLNISIIAGIIFLFFTAKIASYIGFVSGYCFYLLLKRRFLPVIILGVFGLLLWLLFPYLKIISPNLYDRMEYKINTRIVDKYNAYSSSGDEENEDDDFISNNWSGAVRAFKDEPISGTGVGAFGGSSKYGYYEVHSTYFKILGEMGLLGALGYGVLMASIFKIFYFHHRSKDKKENPFKDYLLNALPFFLGCMVSWTYTYHLRKREFWIMAAVFFIAHMLANKWHKLKQKSLHG